MVEESRANSAPETEERKSGGSSSERERGSQQESRGYSGRRSSDRGRSRRYGSSRRRRSKTASGCTIDCPGRQVPEINYRNVEFLQRFVTERGRIRPRRQTGACAKHQRVLVREIKRARFMALLPFSSHES